MAASMNRTTLWIFHCFKTRLPHQTCSFLHHGNRPNLLGEFSQKCLTESECSKNVFHTPSTRQLSVSPLCYFKRKEKLQPTPAKPNLKQNDILVFNSSGTLVGKMSLSRAEDLARKDSLKLVDVGVNQDKVSCYKLLTGKEYFEESMKLKSLKAAEKPKVEKEFRLTAKITDHDLSIKVTQIRDSLKKGKSVKISVRGSRKLPEGDADKLQSAVLRNISEQVQDIAIIKQAVKTSSDLVFVLMPPEKKEENS